MELYKEDWNCMNDKEWDRLLHIRTSGRDDSRSDQYRYPYEPTPYPVLERLARSGYITKRNTLVDYGCGKGRAGFFLAYQVRCRCVGVEYDERIYKAALMNSENAAGRLRISFLHGRAEHYQVPEEADRYYFFNPFSIEILRGVISRIRESWYAFQREMLLLFYYPSDEYISYLMTVEEMLFVDEIDCRDLFEGEDRRERIVIFSFG